MTIDEMEDVLISLDIEFVSNRGDEIQGFCPAHEARTGHKDNNPSWYINSETGMHICFSCQFKGGVVSLVSYIRGISYDDAKAWLNGSGTELNKMLERAIKEKPPVFDELAYISEASLAAFVDVPDHALKKRGLTRTAADLYEIKWSTYRGHENWIVPIRDADSGNLLGWQEKGNVGRYFKNAPAGIPKSKTLFGVHQYVDGDLILVESPLDVVRLASVGVTGGVAAFGAYVSDEQIRLLVERAKGRVVIAMDNDSAGSAAASHVLTTLLSMEQEAWFFDYGDTGMKDVGGMSKLEILTGLADAAHSVRYSLWDNIETIFN